jgi:hypothetical protein
MRKEITFIPEEIVLNKIYYIRGHKVMLDKDLAEMYGVETKRLKEAVKRNLERFPNDFMFQLSENEFASLRSQIATSKNNRGGDRYSPMVFTEHGVLMLSSVLNSAKAIQINIQIMRIFTKIRQLLIENTDLRLAIEKLEKKTDNNSKNIELVFQYLDELLKRNEKNKEMNTIGYKIPKK